MAQCTAKAKSTGKQCNRHAVTGYSVCQVHGAGSVKQGRAGGAPITVGRYSLKHRASLAAKQAEFLADPSPGDLTGELALMRALLQEYLDRYDDNTNLPANEIERIFGMIEAISRIVEKIAKILNSTSLTQADLLQLQSQLALWVSEIIDDPKRRIYAMGRLAEIMGQPARASLSESYTVEVD